MEGWVDLGTAVSVQPVPKAAYRSDFRENANFCPQRDANLGPLAPQASVLPLDHCDLHLEIMMKLSAWHNIMTECLCCSEGCTLFTAHNVVVLNYFRFNGVSCCVIYWASSSSQNLLAKGCFHIRIDFYKTALCSSLCSQLFNVWWTLTAYVYNTVQSELTACNPTLTRWLQHHYKQSRNNNHVSHMPVAK